MRVRKRPVEVEAFQTGSADVPQWMLDAVNNGTAFYDRLGRLTIRTLEGDHLAWPGDWIIRGIKGELYPCKPDIFDATYEVIE